MLGRTRRRRANLVLGCLPQLSGQHSKDQGDLPSSSSPPPQAQMQAGVRSPRVTSEGVLDSWYPEQMPAEPISSCPPGWSPDWPSTLLFPVSMDTQLSMLVSSFSRQLESFWNPWGFRDFSTYQADGGGSTGEHPITAHSLACDIP